MTFPKHIKCVPKYLKDSKGKDVARRAIAPYNFVELPDKVVTVNPKSLLSGDRYYPDLHTGKIICNLTTESPLYIRCGLSLLDFANSKSTNLEDLETCSSQERDRLTDFFKYPKQMLPSIPGSSIRGMLRTMLEIISFSKIERVSDTEKLFFRAVAGNPRVEAVAKEYKKYIQPDKVQAGFLRKDSQGWYIQPSRKVQEKTFAWVRERDTNVDELIKFDQSNYRPQYISVSYGEIAQDNEDRAKRTFASDIASPDVYPDHQGVLVTSGNMKQGNERSPRRNNCLVFQENKKAEKIRLDNIAVEHYCKALTDFQKDAPFSAEKGLLNENRPVPVFYYPPPKGNLIGFFGQSPNFRIPYSPEGNGHASSVVDFVPEALRDPSIIDIADSIFGFVSQEKQSKRNNQSLRGRIRITDAIYQEDKDGIWLSEYSIIPKILGGPKTTTFQHYLVQPEKTKADKAELKHYASQSPSINSSGETVIRGHKLYWHKKDTDISQIQQSDGEKINSAKSQYIEIKPIKAGVSFTFSMHFENLSNVELGALLWALDLAQDDKYRFSLGMGKPLGMGAVKITHHLHLSKRKKRYESLFAGQKWLTGYHDQPDSADDYIKEFDKYICHQIGATEASLKEVRRIKMLLALLSWGEAPSPDQTRYMEIERDERLHHIGTPKKGKVNEYADRPVLPTPLQIIGWEKCDDIEARNSGGSGGSNRCKPDPPKLKGKGRSSPKKLDKHSSSNEGDNTSMKAAFERAKNSKRK